MIGLGFLGKLMMPKWGWCLAWWQVLLGLFTLYIIFNSPSEISSIKWRNRNLSLFRFVIVDSRLIIASVVAKVCFVNVIVLKMLNWREALMIEQFWQKPYYSVDFFHMRYLNENLISSPHIALTNFKRFKTKTVMSATYQRPLPGSWVLPSYARISIVLWNCGLTPFQWSRAHIFRIQVSSGLELPVLSLQCPTDFINCHFQACLRVVLMCYSNYYYWLMTTA